jgi:hypothetical protein
MFRVNLSVQVMVAGLDSNPQPLEDKASGLPLCQLNKTLLHYLPQLSL